MDVHTIETPREAFDALRLRARRGTYRDAYWLQRFGIAAASGRSEQWRDQYLVRDQSVAYPTMRQPLDLTFTVITCGDGRVALHADAAWKSIFGLHRSTALYVLELVGVDVTVQPAWVQTVPEPTLEHIDIHAGNVTARQYHEQVVTELRDTHSVACGMLWCGEYHPVDPADVVPLAQSAVERPMML